MRQGVVMGLEKLLEKNKTAIVTKWFEAVINTYPPDTSAFLRSRKDRFANPVGSTLSRSLDSIFSLLVNGAEREAFVESVDAIVRIRAIQDFTPSQAVGFILSLKTIVRDVIGKSGSDSKIQKELMRLDAQVDGLLLVAFDLYVSCRERIFELKANEEKNKVYKAFKRAGLITETSEGDPGLKASNV